MIEALAKMAEVGKEIGTEAGKGLKSFDARKKIENGDSKIDKSKRDDRKTDKPNIDKRKPMENKEKANKPDKVEKGFSELLKDYIKELKQYAEYPETISDKIFDKIEKVSPEMVKNMRLEFAEQKKSLIKQWEAKNGKEWPKYKEDVYITNKNGEKVKIRTKGDAYDVHHIKPLSLGGKNTVDSITPMRAENHFDSRGIHRLDGPCSKLQDMVKGKD
ncbi:MAG: HNH endonuclease [Saccharofermentans sp.]|nr:HNH endonuclease [Saccharofermentans sp.]